MRPAVDRLPAARDLAARVATAPGPSWAGVARACLTAFGAALGVLTATPPLDAQDARATPPRTPAAARPAPERTAPSARARSRRAARARLQPWWADTTRWPAGTFRWRETVRPAVTLAVGDTLRLAPPVAPPGLPDSIARDVRWSADDPTRVEAHAGGTVVARAAGRTRVVAWTRVGPTITPVRVVAALRGRLLGADGAPVPRTRVIAVRASGRADTTWTDAAGRYRFRAEATSVETPAAAEDAPALPREIVRDPPRTLRLEPQATGDGAPATLHAGAVALAHPFAGAPQDVLLLPRRWTIAAGRYAGTTVAIDPGAAHARAADGSRFWRLAATGFASRNSDDAPGGGRSGADAVGAHAARRPDGPPVGWADARRPIPLAVLGAGLATRTADSVEVWHTVRALEADLGAPLFRPASVEAALGREWRGIAVRVNPRIASAGLALVTYDGSGQIGDAVVELQSRAWLAHPGVLTHELMHALGFGHARGWHSVLVPSVRTPSDDVARASREDVAYAQLFDAVRRLGWRTGAALALDDAAP